MRGIYSVARFAEILSSELGRWHFCTDYCRSDKLRASLPRPFFTPLPSQKIEADSNCGNRSRVKCRRENHLFIVTHLLDDLLENAIIRLDKILGHSNGSIFGQIISIIIFTIHRDVRKEIDEIIFPKKDVI